VYHLQEAHARLALPTGHVPQLHEVNARLEPLTGFRCLPVLGVVPIRKFFGAYRESCFWSSQFIRHHSMRVYTPEPDIVHELFGHAVHLASQPFADLYRLIGESVHRTQSEAALQFLARVFLSTMELGVVQEGPDVMAYGAALLSSSGEIDVFRSARIVPLNLIEMGQTGHSLQNYQPVLYLAESMSNLIEVLSEFYTTFDDAAHARLLGG
jgi:phenylalanine-4-hydroxylase